MPCSRTKNPPRYCEGVLFVIFLKKKTRNAHMRHAILYAFKLDEEPALVKSWLYYVDSVFLSNMFFSKVLEAKKHGQTYDVFCQNKNGAIEKVPFYNSIGC